MEVKIKDKNNLIDATIEVVDGVMVVSPKEETFEPKDGDVVFSGCSLISIFKEMTSYTSLASYVSLNKGELIKGFDFWSASNIRPATEEEKQKLFDRLKEEGYDWKADTKELVKLRWMPKAYNEYYYPVWCAIDRFKPCLTAWLNTQTDRVTYEYGWVFRTKEECKQFCSRLNQAIEGVKP